MAHTHCSTPMPHHDLTNSTMESSQYIQSSAAQLINSKQQGLFTPEVTMTQQINNQQLQLTQNWQGWKFLITFQEISLVLQIVQDLTTAVSQAIFWTAYSPSIFQYFRKKINCIWHRVHCISTTGTQPASAYFLICSTSSHHPTYSSSDLLLFLHHPIKVSDPESQRYIMASYHQRAIILPWWFRTLAQTVLQETS